MSDISFYAGITFARFSDLLQEYTFRKTETHIELDEVGQVVKYSFYSLAINHSVENHPCPRSQNPRLL